MIFMKLALFGATGTVGTALLAQALEAGHEVRVLARTPEKINRRDGALTVLTGNAKDPAAVAATIEGCDAVLTALGGFGDSDSIRIGTAVIGSAMRDAGIRRIVIVQGFHLDFPGDHRNLGRKTILPLLWLGSRTLIGDSRAMASAVRASDLEWTVVRAPRITRGASTGKARSGHLKLGPLSSVTNGDVAGLVLRSLGDATTVGTAPMIANPGIHALGAAGYWLLGKRTGGSRQESREPTAVESMRRTVS
jgi:putative NADH-flavin reductase